MELRSLAVSTFTPKDDSPAQILIKNIYSFLPVCGSVYTRAQVCDPMLACVEARGQFQRLPLWLSILFLRQSFSLNMELTVLARRPGQLATRILLPHQFWNYRRCCSVWPFNINTGGQTLVLTLAQQALYPLAIAQPKPCGRKQVSQVLRKVRRMATERVSQRAPDSDGLKHGPRPYLPLPYTYGANGTQLRVQD